MKDPISTVQSVYGAFARGDVPTVLGALSPDIEWVTPATLPWSAGNYRGHAGVQQYFGQFLEALASPHIEVRELLASEDRVVAIGIEHATARATGRSFAARFTHVWTVRDGRVVKMEGLIDTAQVRAAFD